MVVHPGALIRTLGNLRFRQVRHQVLRRLRRNVGTPLPLRWRRLYPRLAKAKNTDRSYARIGAFTFNNLTRPFDRNWIDSSAPKLWRYNLHYMTWLFDLEEAARQSWIDSWIDGNPPYGGDGWEAYPVSLRLFNWCKHYTLTGSEPPEKVMDSMRQQAGWLSANLEFHLDGNHLLENLLALKYTGFFLDPAHPSSPAVSARIDSFLEETLEDQYLPDGGHYELSPMYHAILLERMLDLLNCWPPDTSPRLRERVAELACAGLGWLETMSVGGRFSLFNDSCYDSAPDAAALCEYGSLLLGCRRQPSALLRELPASGYYRAERGPFTVIFDGGNLGPDHQLGHAQGDMLSFCLWIGESPIIVHPGNFEYVQGDMRAYCRSTAAHNTVALQGLEQAEWWASHRVGRRGRTLEVSACFDAESGTVRLRGAHTGFRWVPGKTMHCRRLEVAAYTVTIEDELTPVPRRAAAGYFHFHPDCEVQQAGASVLIRSDRAVLELSSDRPLRVEEGWHCPEFGLRQRNRVAVADLSDGACRSVFRLVEWESQKIIS